MNEELAFAGVARLGELLRASEVTPRELVELYLARIERLNPRLNAFVSVRAQRALAEADAALKRLRAGEAGPLLGCRWWSKTRSTSPARSQRTAPQLTTPRPAQMQR